MAKNMTRKGLALGAAASLVAAGFAGVTPAYAAFATLDASFGTSGATQNGLLGKSFNMKSTTDVAAIKYYVSGANAAELVVDQRNVTDLEQAIGDDDGDATNDAAGELDYVAASDVDKTVSGAKAATVTPTVVAGKFVQTRWSLTTVTATTTITITPFIDSVVGDGLITAGEVTGTPVSLTFHKASEVTATTTLTAPVIGANKLNASVVLDKGINSAALPAGSVTVGFGVDGGATNPAQAAVAATWSADDAAWIAETAAIATIATGKVYSAQATVAGAANGGNTSTGSAAAGNATAIVDPAFTSSGNVRVNGTNAEVKAGSGDVTVSSTATGAKAGDVVNFKFTRTSLRSAATFTAGGKTLASTGASSITVAAVADADGKASVTASYAGFATTTAADVVTVSTSVVGSAQVHTSANKTITAVDAASNALVASELLGTSAERAIAKGGSASVELHLVDQFGAPVASERRFVYSITNASANVEVSVASSSVTSTGSASVTVTDVSTASSGTFELSVLVQKKDTNGNWVQDRAVAVVSKFNMGQAAAASLTTTSAMASTTAEADRKVLQTVDVKVNDGRKLALGTAPYSGTAAADSFTITGYVKAANGANLAGQPVTVSAAGAGFATAKNTVGAVYTKDSITVYTDSTGLYTVEAYSNKAGQVDYTVTSGAASKTTTAFFKKAALTAGKNLVIDAPAFVAPGSTLMIKATLTDKYGNTVDADTATNKLSISYAGPGLIVSTPTAFVGGALQFGVLLGGNDAGAATVTISVYESTAKVTTAKSITVGATAGAAFTKRVGDTVKVVSQGSAKVEFRINGKKVASRSTLGTLNRTFDLVDGKNVVEIYVAGKRVKRVAYTK